MPNVTAAAKTPKITWRIPENQILLPVKRVIMAPIKNKPNALRAELHNTAVMPVLKKNGITGIMAPTANRKKEASAASMAEPCKSSC